jgi:diguanylate cyclase (GGDEF)-like protein
MRILIADDDAISKIFLSRQLARLGYEVESVQDGTAALKRLQEDSFDIALIDWIMPGCDGPDVCRALRSSGAARYTYIILLTAKDGSRDIIAGLDSGADDYLTKPVNLPELQARLRAARRIIELQDGLISDREQMRVRATRDGLTALYNRTTLFDLAQRDLRIAHRDRSSFALLLCDVDHFKRLNDNYGHPTGDAALREVARRMTQCLRATDHVGRYGGEEFMMALPQTTEGQAVEVAERVRRCICGSPILTADLSLAVSISVGVAVSDDQRQRGFEALTELADAALLLAKRSGRNRVVLDGRPADSGA